MAMSDDLPFQFSIKEPTGIHPVPFILSDLDNDGKDEVLYNINDIHAGEHNIVYLEDNLLSIKWALNFEYPITNFETHDHDQDDQKEIYTLQIIDSLHVLKVFDQTRQLLLMDTVFIGSDFNHDGDYNVVVAFRHFHDLNQDGYDDAIFFLHSGFDYIHRGLIAYDIHSHKRLWLHETGGSPGSTLIEDIDGDGKVEIVLGTNAPANGNVTETTNDNESFIQVIDTEGHLIWQSQIGQTPFSTVNVTTVSDHFSSQPSILTVFMAYGESEIPNNLSLWKYDADRSVLVKTKSVNIPTRIATSQHFGRPTEPDWHILVTTANGKTSKYNNALELMGTYSNPTRSIPVHLGQYVEGFPYNYVAETGKSGIEIYDPDFNLLAKHPEATGLRRIKTGPYGASDLLLETPSIVSRIAFTKSIHSVPKTIYWLILAFGCGILFAMLLWYVLRKKLYWNTNPRVFYNLFEALDVGIMLLDKKRKMIFTNDHFFKMTGIPKTGSYPEKLEAIEGIDWLQKYISDGQYRESSSVMTHMVSQEQRTLQIKSFKMNASDPIRCILLQDNTLQKRASSTIEWASVMQRITHSIRNPLDILGKQMRRMQKEIHKDGTFADNHALVSSMLEEISRLEETTKTFLVFSQLRKRDNQPVCIHETLNKLIDKYQAFSLDTYNIQFNAHAIQTMVTGDKNQLGQAFENIIENGLSAMPDGGILRVELLSSESIEHIGGNINIHAKVRISDEGGGMSEEVLKTIFRPGMSMRSGGAGFGMFITKQVIEDHGGIIEIMSKVNSGTTVEISLPQNRMEITS